MGVVAVVFAMHGSAFAWDATIEGPDVFGVTKVIAIEGSLRESLVIQCDSKDSLFFAYVFPKKEFEEIAEFPVTLLVQTGPEQPTRLEATFRAWNDKFGGVVASGRDATVLKLLKDISQAKGKVNVGFEAKGHQWSGTFGSRGSSKAIQRVTDGCKIPTSASPT